MDEKNNDLYGEGEGLDNNLDFSPGDSDSEQSDEQLADNYDDLDDAPLVGEFDDELDELHDGNYFGADSQDGINDLDDQDSGVFDQDGVDNDLQDDVDGDSLLDADNDDEALGENFTTPRWNSDHEFDADGYGLDSQQDPNDVAVSGADDIFGNAGSIPRYDPSVGDDIRYEDFGDDYPEDDEDHDGLGAWFWTMMGIVGAGLIALVAWLALWWNTGNINPIQAVKDDGTTTQSSDTPMSTESNTESTAGEEAGNQENMIAQLESSLTSAMEESSSQTNKISSLESRAANGATNTFTTTVTRGGGTVTRTKTDTQTTTRNRVNTVTNTQTKTRTVTSLSTRPVTRTSTVTSKQVNTRTVTKTSTVKTPGPARTVTKTVPTGRITYTTTVIERLR